jgi:hypothetical protein
MEYSWKLHTKHLDGLPSFYGPSASTLKFSWISNAMHFLSSSDPISLFFLFSAQIRVVGLDLDEAFLSVLDI